MNNGMGGGVLGINFNGRMVSGWAPGRLSSPAVAGLAEHAEPVLEVYHEVGKLAEHEVKSLRAAATSMGKAFVHEGAHLNVMSRLGKGANILTVGTDLYKGIGDISKISKDYSLTHDQRDRRIGAKSLQILTGLVEGLALNTVCMGIGAAGGPVGIVAGAMIADKLKNALTNYTDKYFDRLGADPSGTINAWA